MLRMVESRLLGWDAALTPEEKAAAERAFELMADIEPSPSAKPVGVMTAAEARRALWLVHLAARRKRSAELVSAFDETRAEATDPMMFAIAEFLMEEAATRNWRFEVGGGFRAG